MAKDGGARRKRRGALFLDRGRYGSRELPPRGVGGCAVERLRRLQLVREGEELTGKSSDPRIDQVPAISWC